MSEFTYRNSINYKYLYSNRIIDELSIGKKKCPNSIIRLSVSVVDVKLGVILNWSYSIIDRVPEQDSRISNNAMLPQRHDKIESLPTEKMAWHAVSGFTKLGLSRENCAADAPGDANRVPAASLANLTPDPPAGTKRNSKRVGTYPRQRPRTAAASSPFPSSLRRDTSRRHRRYDIWVSQHQCRRDILQGWLSRTPLKQNSLVQGYRHTLYSAPLFPPGRGWGPFLAPSLSVPHSRLVRSHGHAPFDKPRLSTSLPSCERASSIRSTLARLLDSPSSDHRLPASFSG